MFGVIDAGIRSLLARHSATKVTEVALGKTTPTAPADSDNSLEPGWRSDNDRKTREAAGDAKCRLLNNLMACGEASWRRAVTWLHCLGEHDRSRSVQHRSFISDKSYSHPEICRSPWSLLWQGRPVSDMVDFPGVDSVTAATGSSVVPLVLLEA
jgi:hypothetical protein